MQQRLAPCARYLVAGSGHRSCGSADQHDHVVRPRFQPSPALRWADEAKELVAWIGRSLYPAGWVKVCNVGTELPTYGFLIGPQVQCRQSVAYIATTQEPTGTDHRDGVGSKDSVERRWMQHHNVDLGAIRFLDRSGPFVKLTLQRVSEAQQIHVAQVNSAAIGVTSGQIPARPPPGNDPL